MNKAGERTYSTPISISTLYRRVSWASVFAGLVIGLAIQLVLSLLGVAIGASTIDPAGGDTPGKGIAIGAGIWLLITGLISTYIGARVAASLSGAVRKADGVLHGVLTWGAATLLTAFLLTSAVGALIGGAMGIVGHAAGAAGQAVASNEKGAVSGRVNVKVDPTKGESREAVGSTGAQTDQQQGVAVSAQDKAQLEQKAREAGDAAARGTSQAAFWSFFLLALSAVAAAMGGSSGRRTNIEPEFEPVAAQ
jgi:hypothetical protein